MKSRPVSAWYSRSRVFTVLSLTIVGPVALAGCRAATHNAVTYADHLPRPPRWSSSMDFTAQPGETYLGSGLIERLKQHAQATNVQEQEIQLQQKLTRTMTTQWGQEIRKLGLPVESAATAERRAHARHREAVLTIEEGNRTRCW
jgi:hypothetical protein